MHAESILDLAAASASWAFSEACAFFGTHTSSSGSELGDPVILT
jgi:hypothetical protein